MFMSVDNLILVETRESLSLQFRAVEVEVVPAKPGMNMSRKTSLSAACRMQILRSGLYGELLQIPETG